jgi:hypothetical protein
LTSSLNHAASWSRYSRFTPVFSFDAFQAPGERLAMKKTQYSNTPAAESPSFPADKPARTVLPWIGRWRTG